MSKLYELTESYKNLQELLDDPAIDTAVIVEAMTKIEDDIRVKADSYKAIFTTMEADINLLKSEEERLSVRRKGIESKLNAMKARLEMELLQINLKKFKTPFHSYWFQKARDSVEVIDPKIVPKKFQEPQPPKIKLNDIMEAITAGEKVRGVRVNEGKEHLRIS